MKRMRVMGWMVQPVLVLDDGENLTPIQVNTAQIAAVDWPRFVDGGWQEQLDRIRVQVEGEPWVSRNHS